MSCHCWEQAASLLENAIKIIPRISIKSLDYDDKQRVLSQLSGLVSDAASVALQAGRGADQALQLLEFGRGIITSLIVDYRNELSELKTTNPDLFDLFVRLRAEISSLIKSQKSCDAHGDQIRDPESLRRKQVMEEIERTLSDIRQIPRYK